MQTLMAVRCYQVPVYLCTAVNGALASDLARALTKSGGVLLSAFPSGSFQIMVRGVSIF